MNQFGWNFVEHNFFGRSREMVYCVEKPNRARVNEHPWITNEARYSPRLPPGAAERNMSAGTV